MLDKFSKNLLGLILQFVNPQEILRCEQLSRKTSSGSKQDYIWRYLCENKLEIYKKFFSDSWKHCFFRNFNATSFMTNTKNFSFQMCPIRHFKKLVKFIDTYENFVVAADVEGNVGIFMINEKDMENDDETLQIKTIATTGVVLLKHLKQNGILIVTTDGHVLLLSIQQGSVDKFEMEAVWTQKLDIQTQTLYACELDEKAEQVFISNYPLNGDDFMADQKVFIVNSVKRTIEFQ